MPVTTFLIREPGRHDDEELAELIDEINAKTGERWVVETRAVRVTTRWFRPDETHSYINLMKWMVGAEYQLMQCVNTVGEAKAYLYGAIGHLKG